MIIFPTDTVYALGCLSNQKERLKDIARIKGIKLEHAPKFLFSDIRSLSSFVSPMDSKLSDLLKACYLVHMLLLEAAKKLPKPFEKEKLLVSEYQTIQY